jgi:hypothetical protein
VEEKMKKLVALMLVGVLGLSVPAYAETAENPGDTLFTGATEEPYLAVTTGYYAENPHGSHGDRMHEGYAAMAPEMYGCAVIIYKAVLNEDNEYELGDFITILEVKDTEYGYSTGDGRPSNIRPDKGSTGTIEAGKHVDVYFDNYDHCLDWMKKTNGYVFVQVIPDVVG